MVTDDPLLQPFQIKHLQLRNRVLSTSHEPAYSEDGMPKDRYRLYHVEKAKGGVALTMTAGTAIVSPDSPPAFGNLHAYDDAIVPWIQANAALSHRDHVSPFAMDRGTTSSSMIMAGWWMGLRLTPRD